MKNTLKLLILSFVIFTTSCDPSKTIVLKRKYNKGYYVDLGTRSNNKSSGITENKTNSFPDKEVIAESNKIQETIPSETMEATLTASNDNSFFIPDKNSKANLFKKEVSKKESTAENNTVTTEKTKSQLASPLIGKMEKSKSTKSNHGDSKLILLVILSFFPILALIAMYIKDGHRITLNFWVDLILHLTVIGYIIFALLVVFDIVNLA